MNNCIEIIADKYVILCKEGIDEFKSQFSSDGNIRLIWEVKQENMFPLFIRTVRDWDDELESDDIYVFDMDIEFEIRHRKEEVEALEKYKGWKA